MRCSLTIVTSRTTTAGALSAVSKREESVSTCVGTWLSHFTHQKDTHKTHTSEYPQRHIRPNHAYIRSHMGIHTHRYHPTPPPSSASAPPPRRPRSCTHVPQSRPQLSTITRFHPHPQPHKLAHAHTRIHTHTLTTLAHVPSHSSPLSASCTSSSSSSL